MATNREALEEAEQAIDRVELAEALPALEHAELAPNSVPRESMARLVVVDGFFFFSRHLESSACWSPLYLM